MKGPQSNGAPLERVQILELVSGARRPILVISRLWVIYGVRQLLHRY